MIEVAMAIQAGAVSRKPVMISGQAPKRRRSQQRQGTVRPQLDEPLPR
jgi:hypothetical protein